MTFLSYISPAIYSRMRVNQIVDELLDPLITPIHVFDNLPIQVKTVINSVKNINFQITDFHTYLSGLYTPTTNKLNSFLTSLNNFPVLKRMFYEDFHKVNNLAIWDKLNDTATLNRWKQMAELNIAKKNNTFIRTPPDINGIRSWIYKGKATDGHSIELCYFSPNSDILNTTLQTIYPVKF
jgi:hypothetical protein